MIVQVDESSFHRDVEMARGAVLVEFVTPSCSACSRIEPWLRQLAQTPGLRVAKIDATRSPNLANYFGVRMAPTLIVFRDGQPMQVIQGAPPSPKRIQDFVRPYL